MQASEKDPALRAFACMPVNVSRLTPHIMSPGSRIPLEKQHPAFDMRRRDITPAAGMNTYPYQALILTILCIVEKDPRHAYSRCASLCH
jgi:hypothetical protein